MVTGAVAVAITVTDCASITNTDTHALLMQWPMCLRLLEEGKIQTEPLITHRLGFSEQDILKGFELAADRVKSGAIKVMFSW